jgi:GTP diphosphokinase / guanosine-3',5'-bis(diphosphate) 3'-diphosphatase
LATISIEQTSLINKVAAYLPPEKVRQIEDAFEFANEAHNTQFRDSGEPYVTHPIAVSEMVADLRLDATTVIASLLHDVQEDCGVSNAEISGRFGADVARIVEGVTKLDQLPWRSPDERFGDADLQAESMRKMFLAMAEDIRVVIIKLADRLHNMRTLGYKAAGDRVRKARETMEIYAPLAARLGIWQIKWELEDLSFRHIEPKRYEEIAALLASKRAARERYVTEVESILREELERQGIQAEVRGRAKHIYSIYNKMERYADLGKTFNEIYDLLALRVIVTSVAECYSGLGVIHQLWHPIPGQFDDYIANPRDGIYRSLHTTVMCLGARPLEVQIRTQEMHEEAEFGIAAHWRYKEGGPKRSDIRYEERIAWLRRLFEWHREISHAEDFVESVKTDLFQDQVFVYTPKGEIRDLPAGATPIDFAYRIHTDLGHRCVGAKVNGRLVSLSYQLHNGDMVEILTSKQARGPTRDWLNPNLGFVRTNHTREKIRQWFKRQERAENIEKGHEMLERELRRLGVHLSQIEGDILKGFKFENLDDFLATLGYGGINITQVVSRLTHLMEPQAPVVPLESGPARPPVINAAIQVLGTGDLLTQLARCCGPVPGDAIIGYVTRSRGVTVHKVDCSNVLHEDEPERLVAVEWGRVGALYPVAIHIEAYDRVGLLRDVSTLIAEEKVNMVGVRTQEHGDRTTSLFLTLETSGVQQLTRLLTKLEGIRGVTNATRTTDINR